MMITGVDRRMGYLTRCDHYTHLPPSLATVLFTPDWLPGPQLALSLAEPDQADLRDCDPDNSEMGGAKLIGLAPH